MYENGNPSESAASAVVPAPTHRRVRRALTGVAVASIAMLGFSLIGTASAATPAAAAGGHGVVSTSKGGGSGSGGGGGTWDQTKVPLPHLPGQAPVFLLQSQTVADVDALDQTSEAAADASMIAFYQNNTACTVDDHAKPNVQFTITCPGGTATVTDTSPVFAGAWVHVFRLVN